MPALLCARKRESLADDVLSGHPEIGDCVARQQPFQINNRIEIVDSVDIDLEPKAADEPAGTTITIKRLLDDVKAEFTDPVFINKLRRSIAPAGGRSS